MDSGCDRLRSLSYRDSYDCTPWSGYSCNPFGTFHTCYRICLGKEIFGKDQDEIKKEGFIIDPLLRQVNPRQVNLPKNPPEENEGLIFGDERSGIKLDQEV